MSNPFDIGDSHLMGEIVIKRVAPLSTARAAAVDQLRSLGFETIADTLADGSEPLASIRFALVDAVWWHWRHVGERADFEAYRDAARILLSIEA